MGFKASTEDAVIGMGCPCTVWVEETTALWDWFAELFAPACGGGGTDALGGKTLGMAEGCTGGTVDGWTEGA